MRYWGRFVMAFNPGICPCLRQVGYVSSWSAYADFKKQHPEEEQDPAKK